MHLIRTHARRYRGETTDLVALHVQDPDGKWWETVIGCQRGKRWNLDHHKIEEIFAADQREPAFARIFHPVNFQPLK